MTPAALAAVAILAALPADPCRVVRLGYVPQALAADPTGKLFATARDTNWIDVWELPTGKKLHSVRCSDGDRVAVLAFSPDGKTLAAGAWYTNLLRAWDAASGEERFTVAANENGIRALAFSPDGKLLASGGEDGQVRLFDAATGKSRAALHERQGRPGYVTGLAFDPTGRLLAAASSYDTVGHLWRVEPVGRGREFAGHSAAGRAEGHSVAFSPDGRSLLIAYGDGVALLETATGQARWIAAAGQGVAAVALAPDGRTAASVSVFRPEVQLWDAHTGRPLPPLRRHRGGAWAVTFVGGKLLTVGEDETVRVWDPPRPAPAAAARLTDRDTARLWKELSGDDVSAAFAAIRRLAADPDAAVRLVRGRLKPVGPPDAAAAAEVRKLVAGLSGDDFDAREAATRRLRQLAPAAHTELLRARKAATDPEVAYRLDEVLRAAAPPSSEVVAARCLELLERVNTPAARAAVKDLAAGDPDASLTLDGRVTLARMERAAGRW